MKCVLMHKRRPVALMELDSMSGRITSILDVYALEHAPVGTVGANGLDRRLLDAWWRGRSIPASRDGLDGALDKLGVETTTLLLEKSYGLSLSDQYWICPEGVVLKWEEINFFENSFSEDVGNILFGRNASGEISFMTPDNTSDGWLRKKWTIIDGGRYLLKGGSGTVRQEPYNEVIASAIMQRLGIPHVPYTVALQDSYPYSVCRDFITVHTELVSAHNLIKTQKQAGHHSLYEHLLSCCEHLEIPDAKGYLDRMITVDYLIANEDRHLGNFGVIRNPDTLEYSGFAPIFDSGTSLWSATPTQLIRPTAPKLAAKPFTRSHYEQIKLVSSFEWLDLSALKGFPEECREILSDSPFMDDARIDTLCSAVTDRINLLEEIVIQKDRQAIVPEIGSNSGTRSSVLERLREIKRQQDTGTPEQSMPERNER